MRYGFYETPAEAELDAAYTSERESERELNRRHDAAMAERWECTDPAHVYGYDCPRCEARAELAYFHWQVEQGRVLIDRPRLTELAPPVYLGPLNPADEPPF